METYEKNIRPKKREIKKKGTQYQRKRKKIQNEVKERNQ